MNSQFMPDRFQQNNIVPPTSEQQHGQHYPLSNDQLPTSDRYIGQQSNQDLRPPMNGTQNYSNDALQFTKPNVSSSNIPNNMHSLTNDMNQLNCGSDLNQNQPTPMVSAFSPQPQKSFSSDPSHVQSNNSEGFPMTYNKIQHNGSATGNSSNPQNVTQFSEDKLNRSANSNLQNGPQNTFHSQQLEGTKHQDLQPQLSNAPPENTFESKVIQNAEFQSQHTNFSQHQFGFQTQESRKPLQKPSAALQQPSFPPQSTSVGEQPGFSPQASSVPQQQGFPSNSNSIMQKPGFPSDANSISQQPGFPPQPSSSAAQQQRFPPNSNSALQKPGFPLDANAISQQPGFPPQPSSAPQPQGFAQNSNSTMQKPGFPPQQSGFPPQPISAPQQQGFPSQPNSISQPPGFPPQPISAAQQQGFPSQPNSISQQPGFPPQPVAASQQQGFPLHSNSIMQKPGFPPQPNLISQQSGLPPQSTLPSQQQGFPPQPSSTPQQSGFPPQSNSETQKPGFPSLLNSIPQQSGFQPQQPGFPPQQQGFPPQANPTPQQSGFPPLSSSASLQTGPHSKSNLSSNQPGFPPQPNLTPQQSGYPTKQPGFPPQSSTASQYSGVGVQSSLPLQQPGFPTQTNLNTQNPEFPIVSNLSRQRQGFPPQPNSTMQQPGFLPQPSVMQQPGFPPQPSAMQQQQGFPPQPSAVQQSGFPPQPSAMQQQGFPSQPSAVQQSGFPPQPSAMQQPGFPPQPLGLGLSQPQGFPSQPVPSQQPGIPPQGFPQTQGNFPPQQPGYPSQQPGYPPNQQTGTPAYMGQPAPNRRLDPDQMPSPVQVMEDDQHSKGGVFLTNQRGLVPPLVTTDFTVQDGGNASPRLIRSTMYSVPITTDIMKQTSVPFGLVISPMAKMKYDEYSPPIINTGDVGPVRCKRCKAYMSPFMQFIDGGKHFVCLLCKASTEVPVEYFQHLDHTGQRLDRSERPELCFGSYEFIVPKEYCRKEIQPKPPAYVFVIDVSYNNVKSGLVRLICSYMKELLTQLPTELGDEKSKIRVGFITYDTTIHFYNIKETLVVPQMMVVGDTTEMFMPLLDGFLCDPEKSSHVIDALMEQIPIQFNETRTTETVLYPAIKAGIEALKNADCCGKLFVFHSSLPIAEAPGKLKNREDRKLLATDKEKSVLNPQTSIYKELGEECVQVGCGVDLFVTNNSYIDLATIGQVSRISGGEIFKYTYFQAEFDGKRFLSDLKRDISRPTVFDAVMRVRTSTGVRPTDFYGHFNMSNTTDVELGAIDCDKAIAIEVKHDDKLDEQDGVLIQTAMLYTSCSGQRRVRILNLSLRSSGEMGDLYRSCDLDTIMNFFGKQVMYKILESSGRQVKDAIINKTAQILACYRKHCASPTSAGQLILPECMKLMPLYLNCLIKSDAMSGGPDMTVDDRWYNMHLVITADIPTTLGYFYPRLIPIHTLENETNLADVAIPCQLRCSIEKFSESGAYILENGVFMFLWLGLGLSQTFLTDVFGVTNCTQVNTERTDIPVIDNPLNKAVREVISKIQDERSHTMRLSIIRQRDKIEIVMRHFLVEDHIDNSSSYVEFLCHMHKEIRNLLS